MKHWCNNVDWSLDSVFLNINNGGDSKRFWVGDPLFEYFEEGHFLFRNDRVPFKIMGYFLS